MESKAAAEGSIGSKAAANDPPYIRYVGEDETAGSQAAAAVKGLRRSSRCLDN